MSLPVYSSLKTDFDDVFETAQVVAIGGQNLSVVTATSLTTTLPPTIAPTTSTTATTSTTTNATTPEPILSMVEIVALSTSGGVVLIVVVVIAAVVCTKKNQTKKFRQTSQRYSAPPDSKNEDAERAIDDKDDDGERDIDEKDEHGERKDEHGESDINERKKAEVDDDAAPRTVKTHKQTPHLRETNESPPTSQQAAWNLAYVPRAITKKQKNN